MTRFLSPRLFEFPIRAAQKLAQNGYRFENNGSFTVPGFQRWLALLVAVSATLRVYLSSCSFRLRRGSRKMISRAKRIVRYPRPFPRIKSRISKRGRETKRPVVVNFMQILAFREFVSFHHREIPARSRAHNGDTRSSSPPPLYEILYTRCPFPVIYSRLLYSKNSSSNRATRVIPFWSIIFTLLLTVTSLAKLCKK